MRLFIQVKNGEAINHPISEENILMFNSEFDHTNLPEELERFNRIDPPEVGPWEKLVVLPYIKLNGVWSDDYKIVPLDEAEKKEKIKKIRDNFPFKKTWKFDSKKGEWIPPKPYPNDGRAHVWFDKAKKWVSVDEIEKPTVDYPDDGRPYSWNAETKEWILMDEAMNWGNN